MSASEEDEQEVVQKFELKKTRILFELKIRVVYGGCDRSYVQLGTQFPILGDHHTKHFAT